jgi:hypothetical protein
MDEFHVMSSKTVQGVKAELDKRYREGWRLLEAYGVGSNEHVLIFHRTKP